MRLLLAAAILSLGAIAACSADNSTNAADTAANSTADSAEVILDRVADRLAGHTHDEVVAKHPLPPGDSQQGTAA